MTSDSIRIQLAIDTVHYLADTTGNDLLEKIKVHNDVGKTILVIGHSNTIPVKYKKVWCHIRKNSNHTNHAATTIKYPLRKDKQQKNK